MRRFLTIALLALAAASAADARGLGRRGYPSAIAPGNTSNFYVATTGSDANTGTIGSPFKTITKAQAAVQTSLAVGQCPSVTFRGGTYPLAATLNLGAADSGSAGCTVIWQSYPNENAIWSGGSDLSGTWSLCTTADTVCNSGANGVYKSSATPTTLREFYVNGTHRTRARNLSTNVSGWTTTGGGYTLSGFPAPTSSWKNVSKIEIITAGGFPSNQFTPGWQQIRCTIGSISGTAVTMATPCWTNINTWEVGKWSAATFPWWVENAYELLPDCGAGCWYYDYGASTLYYHPNGGENMATATTYVPQLTRLITFNAAHHLEFDRLTFEGATWLPDTGGDDYVVSQGGYYCTGVQPCAKACTGATWCTNAVDTTPVDAAIRATNGSHDLTFNHNLFTHNGARSLLFEHGSQNVTIYANNFVDNGAGPVQWGEALDYAQSNAALQTANLLFKDNQIDEPFEWIDTYQIYALITRNSTIDHNTFLPTTELSIGLGANWSTPIWDVSYATGNTISNNWVKSPCRQFFDCAGIYIGGGNEPSLNVTNNYVTQTNNSNMKAGLYPDDGTNGSTWSGNVISPGNGGGGTPLWMLAWVNTITGNTFSGNFTTTATNAYTDADTNTITGTVQYTPGCSPNSGTCPLNTINNAGVEAGVTPGP